MGGTISGGGSYAAKVEGSPPVDADKPVPLQFEESYLERRLPQTGRLASAFAMLSGLDTAEGLEDEHLHVDLRSTNG